MTGTCATFAKSNPPAVSGFPAPRRYAIIRMRRGAGATGPGRNAATVDKPTVAGSVAGKNQAKSNGWVAAATPQRSFASHVYVRAHARPCAWGPLFSPLRRCGYIYPSEKTEKKAATMPATVGFATVAALRPVGLPSSTPWFRSKRGEIADARA